MRKLAAVLVLSFLLTISTSAQLKLPKGSFCGPLFYSGITVGSSDRAQVERLLGPGVYREQEGHTGGLYYLDPSGSYLLHLELEVDDIVGSLSVSSATSKKLSAAEQRKAVSKYFDPKHMIIYNTVFLGSSRDAVSQAFGLPKRRINADTWLYESTCSCELPDELVVRFKENKVVGFSMSEEE